MILLQFLIKTFASEIIIGKNGRYSWQKTGIYSLPHKQDHQKAIDNDVLVKNDLRVNEETEKNIRLG